MWRGFSNTGFGFDVWIYWHLIQCSELHAITALSLFSHFIGNGFPYSSYSSLTVTAAHIKSSLRLVIPFLPFLLNHLWLSSPEFGPILDNFLKRPSLSLYSPRHGPSRKHRLSIVEKACLLLRCVAMDLILWRAYASFHAKVFAKSLPNNGSIRKL
jgi:hypothetical protein